MEIGQKKIVSLVILLITMFFSTPQVFAMEKSEQKEKSITSKELIQKILTQDKSSFESGQAVIPADELAKTLNEYIKILSSFIKKQGDSSTLGKPHIQKLHLKQKNGEYDIRKNQVVVMGDIRGHTHSATSLIQHLQSNQFKYVNKTLKLIEPDTNMVFTGNIAGPGCRGIEAWYLLMQLVIRNQKKDHPGTVFIIRGSDEQEDISKKNGFSHELFNKYGKEEGKPLFTSFIKLFSLLPSTLYIGSGKNFIQINHGGVPITGKKNPQLTFKKELIQFLSSNNKKTIMEIDSNTDLQLRCGDFAPEDTISSQCRNLKNVYTVGVENIKALYEETGVKFIVRSHQHQTAAISYISRSSKAWKGMILNAMYYFSSLPPMLTCTSCPSYNSNYDLDVNNSYPIGFCVLAMCGYTKIPLKPHAYRNWTIHPYDLSEKKK